MRRLAAAGVAAAALGGGLLAQQRPPNPVFRAGTDYVRVDVVVTDSDDRPITNLTKDDFAIVEQGRAQAIDDFQYVSVPVTRSSRSTAPAGPPPDVATNTPPTPNSRLFVMVIDDLHILEQDLVHTKEIMTDFIRALAPDDEMAVVFVGRSDLSQNFTTDRGRLLATADRVRAALGFGLDALGQSTAGSVQNTGKYIHSVAVRTDDVLKNVALSLAGSNHPRRAIVFVTAGSIVPTVPNPDNLYPDDFDDLREVYALAHRADVPIYTIDPRGQVLPDEAIRGGIGNIGVMSQGDAQGSSNGGTRRSLIAANIRRQNDRLAEVAVNTGGLAFTNQSNLSRAVGEIVADNSSYYLLGYYPSPFAADGRFHTFDVRVNRPGARVRARGGYVAAKLDASTGDAKPILDAAMSAGVNVSAVSLRVFAAPIAPGPKGMNTVVTVEVAYPPRPDGSRDLNDDLVMNIIAMDPDARVKATSGRTAHFEGAARGQGPIAVRVSDVIDLPSQPLTLRVAVASRALGKAGSVQTSVDVPKPGDNKLQLGGIVLGVAGGGSEPAATEAGALRDLLPFEPTTTRTFSSDATLRLYTRAFWGAKGAATVTIALTGPSTMPPRTINVGGTRSAAGRADATLDTTLPLTGLTPGRYDLVVAAKVGGQTAKRTVPIEIRELSSTGRQVRQVRQVRQIRSSISHSLIRSFPHRPAEGARGVGRVDRRAIVAAGRVRTGLCVVPRCILMTTESGGRLGGTAARPAAAWIVPGNSAGRRDSRPSRVDGTSRARCRRADPPTGGLVWTIRRPVASSTRQSGA